MSDCKSCPLQAAYRFKTQCRVTSCKFYSERTRSKCLGMDITFAAEDKPFSDGELLHYKFSDKEMTVKEVARIRKKAVDQVKNLIMLHHLITTLSELYSDKDGLRYEPGRSSLVDDLITGSVLSLPKLDFEPWMLTLIFDESLTLKLVGPKFRLKDALKLSTKEFAAVARAVKILDSGETLFDNVV